MTENISDQTNTDRKKIIAIYTNYIINKLSALLRKLSVRDEEILSPDDIIVELEKFVHDYYFVIKNSLLPTKYPYLKLTAICLTLAQLLEDYTFKSRYQILMPCIKTIEYEASGMSLRDRDLKLTDFILSDDETHVIEVAPSLNFAEEDGILKHTRLFDGQAKPLSAHEAECIISHSTFTKNYWEAIQQKINIELHGESYGSIIKQLANSLAAGGAHATLGGSEFDSGNKANVGIQQFFAWHETLEEAEQLELAIYKSKNSECNLGYYLAQLGRTYNRENEGEYKNTRYCVEIISNCLNSILQDNPSLYDKYPKNNTAACQSSIEAARLRVEQAREALKIAMLSDNYPLFSDIDHDVLGYYNLCNALSRINDLEEYANDEIDDYFNRNDNIIAFLQDIDASNRMAFLYHIKNCLSGSIYTQNNIFKNIDSVSTILNLLEVQDRKSFLDLFSTHISLIIEKLTDFTTIQRYFSIEESPAILASLFKNQSDYYSSDPEIIIYLMNNFDDENSDKLIGEFIKNQKRIYYIGYKNILDGIHSIGRREMFQKKILKTLVATFEDMSAFRDFICSLDSNKWHDVFMDLSLARAYDLSDKLNDEHAFQCFKVLKESFPWSRFDWDLFLLTASIFVNDRFALMSQFIEYEPHKGRRLHFSLWHKDKRAHYAKSHVDRSILSIWHIQALDSLRSFGLTPQMLLVFDRYREGPVLDAVELCLLRQLVVENGLTIEKALNHIEERSSEKDYDPLSEMGRFPHPLR